MGLRSTWNKWSAWVRGQDPARVYAETAHIAGFLQTPTSPAPDAKHLIETEQISAIVGRCVQVISEDAASVPLKLFDVTVPDKPVEIFDHDAIKLWRHINRVEFPAIYIQQLFADLITEGNHFARLNRDPVTKVPVSMIRLPPEQVEVLPDPAKIIGGYKWKRADSKEEEYSEEEIMHVRTRNPNPIYRGLGLLARGRDQIRLEYYLRQWKEYQIKNGIPVSLVFKIKRGNVNDAELERFQEELTRRMSGLRNTGKPAVIRSEDVEIDKLDRPKEEETAFMALLKYTRGEFLSLFGVPPSRVSDYSESFRASANAQTQTYWQDTIMAWHRLFVDYLNSCFIPKWFKDDVDRRTLMPRIQFAFDYSKVRALAISTRDMATAQEIMIRNAMRTPARATVAMGDPMPDDPEADKLRINGKPLDSSDSKPDEETDSPPTGGEQRPPGATEPADGEEIGPAEGLEAVLGGDGVARRPVPLKKVEVGR